MGYAREVTRLVKDHPLVTFVEKEVTAIPREGIVIIATGPLTEGALAEDIENFCGGEGFHFYDAAAPIVTKDSWIWTWCTACPATIKGKRLT